MAKSHRICSVDGCNKPHLARGLCPMHYARFKAHGDVNAPDNRLRPKKACSVDGCEKLAHANGMCTSHYGRWHKHGDPLAGGTGQGEARRWVESIALTWASDDCLLWPYATLKSGYGKLWSGDRLVLAHRYVCEAVYGEPPSEDYEVAHRCGVNSCVNPHHLRWATHIENEADKVAHGTRLRGQSIVNSKLTEDDVRRIRETAGVFSQKDAARIFGVSRATIAAIRARKVWAWLP